MERKSTQGDTTMENTENYLLQRSLTGHGQRLLQIGISMLLLTSFWGFLFPSLASPYLGLSAHKLTALLALLMLVFGLLWPKLILRQSAARIAFILLIYSSFAIIAAYVLGAIWGAGGETIKLAAHGAHGTTFQETIIAIVAYSSAPSGIIAFILILWGLRNKKDVHFVFKN